MALLVLLSLVSQVSSAPFHRHHSTSTSDVVDQRIFLFVFLSILTLLCFLLIAKRLFLQIRRDQSNAAMASANNSFISNTSSALLGPGGMESLKSGFVVGFFGSPDWETRPEIVCSKPASGQGKRMYHLQTKSHSSHRTGTARSKGSGTRATCSSSTLAKHAGRNASLSPGRWQPDGLHKDNLNAGTAARYFSLPAPKSRERAVLRRHASLVLPMVQYPQGVASDDELGFSSRRLVETSCSPDVPLPLAPTKSCQKNNSEHKVLPPNPALPTLSDFEPGNGVTTWLGLPQQQPEPEQISLTKTTHPQEDTLIHPLYSRLHNSIVFPTCPDIAQPGEYSVLLKQAEGSKISPPLPLLNQAAGPRLPLRLQTQFRRPSRPRRSPTLAPSPLRRMILPDSSDSVMGCVPSNKLGESNSTKSSPFCSGNRRASPSTSRKTSGEQASPTLFHEDFNSNGRPCSQDDPDDPNILLGMIRELVEETSAWDPDLFMDPKFKSMMEESRLSLAVPLVRPKSQASGGTSSSPNSSTRNPSAGSPISSTGHQNDFFTRSPATSASHHHPKELMEFWNGQRWIEHNQAETVGVAW